MSHGNLMLDELEARINDMVITSSNLDQRWNDVLDINQVAAVLDEMEGLFDHMEDQLRHSREGGLNKITKGTGAGGSRPCGHLLGKS